MLTELFETIPIEIIDRIQDLNLDIQSENCNKEINSLLQKTVLVGGKRLRPMLTFLMGNLFGKSPDEIDTYARAIELVHAASLSHDDVVDQATTRRGVPSINIASSNKRAVLAGDYLLADVIVELTKKGNLKVVEEMSRVIQDLAEGEWLQLDASESRHYTKELIEEIANKKTASVMSWCCLAPAIISGQNESVIEYSRKFGYHLGIAFQQMDDTLDFSGNSKKDKFLDLKNGIVNSVLYEWLELNPEIKKKFESGEDIISLFDKTQIDKAVSLIQASAWDHLDKAKDILEILEKECNHPDIKKAKLPLSKIIEFIGKRSY